MKESRNRPCPCGSGQKFKRCCERATTPTPLGTRIVWTILTIVLVAGLAGAVVALTTTERSGEGDRSGLVWCASCGQWHAPGGHEGPVATRPPGPPPPGKVWSEEHGHWHDMAQEPAILDPSPEVGTGYTPDLDQGRAPVAPGLSAPTREEVEAALD